LASYIKQSTESIPHMLLGAIDQWFSIRGLEQNKGPKQTSKVA